MSKKTICSHTLVRNEGRFLWFAVMSVINHVDRVLLWDTGSTDQTIEIINEIKRMFPKKVSVNKLGSVSPEEFTLVRQRMIDDTLEDWVIIVDGDEIWWEQGIASVVNTIGQNDSLESIVTKYINLLGDIYHYQDEQASHYRIDNYIGSITIRAMNRRIPGLSVKKPHGTQGFFDEDNILVQDRSPQKRIHIDEPGYLHFTHLSRAGKTALDKAVIKRIQKYKYELGNPFSLDFYYPEVFFRPHPDIVPSPWVKRSKIYEVHAIVETLPKKLRRTFLKIPEGY